MGLFGKLFERKICSICGEEIKLLGNRKLEDGNMCKHCAEKLSPWFDDRRHSTVAQIEEQLAYREANKEEVAKFNTTRVYGEWTKIYLDEDAGKFMVTDAGSKKEIENANPDVVPFSKVTGCEVDIDENRIELKKTDKDGNSVSYVPPKYEYEYNFYIVIRVSHPYFDEIRVKINNSSVDVQVTGAQRPTTSAKYQQYKQTCEEIKATLLKERQESRDASAKTEVKTAVTCPNCGATTIPDAAGRCEYCGGTVRN